MKCMTSAELRETFLRFFEERGHERVPSGPLVPEDDPTLLFTNAGMVQFKDLFLGEREAGFFRATTAQKCVRAGGKHNDLENVGQTARHQTFFEMLGNFSFGDYFKEEAIRYAWELMVHELEVPADRLWITVFRDDDEAAELWRHISDVPEERILRLDEQDNFWSMGDVGPCGPCSEIIFDRGQKHRCDGDECAIGACDCDRWLELWNLVFMQYQRDEDGEMTPLERTGVDTGMGLERMVSVLQGVDSNYDTDLFSALIAQVQKLSGHRYGASDSREDFAFRVIVDHIRTAVFLISDGVLPSNEGRGYVLRRILRRACRFGRVLELKQPFMHLLVDPVTELMSEGYPELQETSGFARQMIRTEEERFGATLEQGLGVLNEVLGETEQAGRDEIAAEDAFKLYDTFGFPVDLCEDVAADRGLSVDRTGFDELMQRQRRRAREAQEREGAAGALGESLHAVSEIPDCEFCGYDCLEVAAHLTALVADGKRQDSLQAGEEGWVILDRTPFYGESGGQVGDAGRLRGPHGRARVTDSQILGDDQVLHRVEIRGGILTDGEEVAARVDARRRLDVARNHTATHLLHAALRRILGEHAHQAGSLVGPDRFRFDFTHPVALSPETLREIEDQVNEWILSCRSVQPWHTSFARAAEEGALALFGESYDEDDVRVICIDGVSLELCGGTHVACTSEIGTCKILTESSVGSGLRRIEAVTGRGVMQWMREQEELGAELSRVLDSAPGDLAEQARELVREMEKQRRRVQRLEARLGEYQVQDLLHEAEQVNGVSVLAARADADDADGLRQMADSLRGKLGDSAVLLAAVAGGSAVVIGAATDGVVSRGVDMGDVVGSVGRKLGGGGGGRPDMAQAGGDRTEKLPEALEHGREAIRAALTGEDGP